MKKLLFVVSILLCVSLASHAQKGRFTEAENEGWLVSIEEAYDISKKTGKPILANFTGSDWCGWCKKLSAEVFRKESFQDWAKENVVLLELDYPRRKKLSDEQKSQNHELQQAFKVTGFPTVWVFDLDKDEETKRLQISAIGKLGYVRGGSDAFTNYVDEMITATKK